MLSNLSVEGIMSTALINESFSISANQEYYLIGSGQTLNTVKPNEIISAQIRGSNNIDIGLNIIISDLYFGLSDKTVLGTPNRLYYDAGATQQATQVGRIYLYPRADTSYTLIIQSEKEWSRFTEGSSTSTFPSCYNLPLTYLLALHLAPLYGKTPSDVIVSVADRAKRNLYSMNAKVLTADVGLWGAGKVNIYTDGD